MHITMLFSERVIPIAAADKLFVMTFCLPKNLRKIFAICSLFTPLVVCNVQLCSTEDPLVKKMKQRGAQLLPKAEIWPLRIWFSDQNFEAQLFPQKWMLLKGVEHQ